MSCLQQVSSGTEGEARYEVIDEKKKRRMISNRESARRSRRRKQQRIEDLIRESDHLARGNQELFTKINELTQRHLTVETENGVLRAEVAELTARLNYLNAVVSDGEKSMANRAFSTPNNGGIPHGGTDFPFMEFDGLQDFGGFSMGVSDPLLGPWQSAGSSQPIMASAGMLQF
ncbi:hypothetical protein L1049_016911 [Liquidambar formosana]|uniref:BZIP domain-containing protein n=1 Tax=Liquidambar formosana TaxID=63359 RepID=A0AAP0S7C6_LIQFO